MRAIMVEEIKRWTARRKSTLVLEIIHGKTTVARRAVSSTRPAPGGDRALGGEWQARHGERLARQARGCSGAVPAQGATGNPW